MSQQPALFLSHGSPMMAIEDGSTARFLRGLPAALPRPAALLVASAHWETDMPALTGSAQPETIYDFHGFPPELYRLRYPARGDAALAAQAQALLAQAGIAAAVDPQRGFDHGVWSPLHLMYPAADIPVVELSIQPDRDASWHYAVGRALADLREAGVMIVGTGNLTHNLYEAMRGQHATVPDWVSAFSAWFSERLAAGDTDALLDWERAAPFARKNHPTPEHLMPFFVALGASSAPLQARRLYDGIDLGVLAMDAYIFA